MPIVQETGWTEETLPIQLSPEEIEAVQARVKALDALFKGAAKARYKIELMFSKDRSIHHPHVGAVTFWESGERSHGGGDSKLYICPGKALGKNDCEAFIPDSANGSAVLFCPGCGIRWKGEEVIGERFARLPTQKWAEVLLYYFVRFDNNADIYLKYAKEDTRTAAMLEQVRQRGGDVLRQMRDSRAKAIYPLVNIIKDVANGADIQRRFYAFLCA